MEKKKRKWEEEEEKERKRNTKRGKTAMSQQNQQKVGFDRQEKTLTFQRLRKKCLQICLGGEVDRWYTC